MKLFLVFLRIIPPELAHIVALNSLNFLYKLRLINFFFPAQSFENQYKFKSLIFKNRLGIAAGIDKNGDFFESLGALGFGFIEIGTVTPKAQSGNPKPRVFRFTNQGAIINNLGFNNKGVDYLVSRVKKRNYSGILGINIGANKDSIGQKRIDDYIECFKKVSPYADYISVNISSPNTPNLRSLHLEENFIPLFEALNDARLEQKFSNPIFFKLSPDEENKTISIIVKAIKDFNFDGIIASNTTVKRNFKNNYINLEDIHGGLSGKPLLEQSNKLLSLIHSDEPDLLKIGVGGVHNKESFNTKLDRGASLVQIYTSFIYQGPKIVKKLIN